MATGRCSPRCASRAAMGRSRRWSICTVAPGALPTATPTGCVTNSSRAMASPWCRSTGAAGREGAYPLALTDINYAVRWTKLHAKDLKTRPDLVGISGQSSGGHLAMLAAASARSALHRDPAAGWLTRARRFGEVRRAVMAGDQSDRPLSLRAAARPRSIRRRTGHKGIIDRHNQFWGSEANMIEGNPMLILERGEKPELPPAIWHQGRGDLMHDYKDEDFKGSDTEAPRFTASYPQGRRRHRAQLLRHRPEARPLAGPHQDRRHVRADAGVYRQAREVNLQCVGWAKARPPALYALFTRYGRAHVFFLLGATTWARRLRGFAHPCNSETVYRLRVPKGMLCRGRPSAAGRWRSDQPALSRFWLPRSVIVVSAFIGPGWLPEHLVRFTRQGSTKMTQTSTDGRNRYVEGQARYRGSRPMPNRWQVANDADAAGGGWPRSWQGRRRAHRHRGDRRLRARRGRASAGGGLHRPCSAADPGQAYARLHLRRAKNDALDAALIAACAAAIEPPSDRAGRAAGRAWRTI